MPSLPSASKRRRTRPPASGGAHLLVAAAQPGHELRPGRVDRDVQLLVADHERRDLRVWRHRRKR